MSNQFSKETIEKYMKEMMELSKKSTTRSASVSTTTLKKQPEPLIIQTMPAQNFESDMMPDIPPCQAEPTGCSCNNPTESRENATNFLTPDGVNYFIDEPPVPGTPNAEAEETGDVADNEYVDDIDSYWEARRKMDSSADKNISDVNSNEQEQVPEDTYIDDIDDYLKEKEKMDSRLFPGETEYHDDAYIDDIDVYLRQKEDLQRFSSEDSASVSAYNRITEEEDIDRHLNHQAELLRSASALPYEQRIRRENDIFINSLNWGASNPYVKKQEGPVVRINDDVYTEDNNSSGKEEKESTQPLHEQQPPTVDMIPAEKETEIEKLTKEDYVWPSFPSFDEKKYSTKETFPQMEPGLHHACSVDWQVSSSTIDEVRMDEFSSEPIDSAELTPEQTWPFYPLEREDSPDPITPNFPSDTAPPELFQPNESEISTDPAPEPIDQEESPSTQQKNNGQDQLTEEPPSVDLTDEGYLWIEATSGDGVVPIADATAVIYRKEGSNLIFHYKALTDQNGEIPRIALPTPPRNRSMKPGSGIPYQTYSVDIFKCGYYAAKNNGIQMFGGVDSFLPVNMVPLPIGAPQENPEIITEIPPNDLQNS